MLQRPDVTGEKYAQQNNAVYFAGTCNKIMDSILLIYNTKQF